MLHRIIRWSSLALAIGLVGLLLFGISMRGMIHSEPKPSLARMCLDVLPPLLFLLYIFRFTFRPGESPNYNLLGLAVVGYLLWWLASARRPEGADATFYVTMGILAPFVVYWIRQLTIKSKVR